MDRGYSEETKKGCFAWLFRVKKSVNERLARVRNALRRKLSKENRLAKPLTPDDLENETGSPDLIITRVLASPRSNVSTGEIPSAVVTDGAKSPLPGECDTQGLKLENGYIRCSLDGNPDPLQVSDFVKGIIASAESEINIRQISRDTIEDTASLTSSILSVMANDAVTKSLTNIVQDLAEESNMTVFVDTESLSSRALSDLAEAAVTESLTKIINEPDDVTASVNDAQE